MREFIKCPKCSGIYRNIVYNESTYEEAGICILCGYRRSYIIQRDHEGNVVINSDGSLVIKEDSQKEGYGLVAYKFTNKDEEDLSGSSYGFYAFNEPVGFDTVVNYIDNLKKTELNKEVIYATIYKDNNLYNVYGRLPMFYENNITRVIDLIGIDPIMEGNKKQSIEGLVLQTLRVKP